MERGRGKRNKESEMEKGECKWNMDPDLPRFFSANSAIPRNLRQLSCIYMEILKENSAATAVYQGP